MTTSRTSLVGILALLALSLTTSLFATASNADTSTPDSIPPDTPPPGQLVYTDSSKPISLPFEIYRGDIRFDCKVNGHPVKMLLDDGFLWDQLLFWGGPVCDSLGFEYDGALDVGGGNQDNVGAARSASGVTVSFPGVGLRQQDAVVMPPTSGASSSWSGSAGQISAGLLKNFIVQFDFDRMIMTLQPRDSFTYAGSGSAVPWTPMGHGPRSIPITLTLFDGRTLTLDVFMDLGYNDQFQLASDGEHHLGLPPERFPSIPGYNIRGEATRAYIGRLPEVDIGDYQLSSVPADFVVPEQSDDVVTEIMIGLGLLSRFNLTFDFYGRTIYFEPNESFDRPFEISMTGFRLTKQPDCTSVVSYVHPDSPADHAGIKPGDKILSINGKPFSDYDHFDLKALFRREGETVTLETSRDGQRRAVTLILTRVI